MTRYMRLSGLNMVEDLVLCVQQSFGLFNCRIEPEPVPAFRKLKSIKADAIFKQPSADSCNCLVTRLECFGDLFPLVLGLLCLMGGYGIRDTVPSPLSSACRSLDSSDQKHPLENHNHVRDCVELDRLTWV
jgi:hypothetical protein